MNEFKIGDKVRLRDDLEEGEVWGRSIWRIDFFKWYERITRKRIDNRLYR